MQQQPTRTLTFALPRWHPSRRLQAAMAAVVLAVVSLSGAVLWSAEAQAAPTAYSIWAATTVPKNAADAEAASVELGVRFRSSSDGWVTGIRFYKSAANTGVHTGTLWSSTGSALAKATFTAESASGWQEARLATPVRLALNTDYVASYRAPKGRYASDTGTLSPSQPKSTYALTATQGVYTYGTVMPTDTWQDTNYYVDVAFTTVAPGSPTPTTTPSPSSTSTPSPTGSPTVPRPPMFTVVPGAATPTRTRAPTPTPPAGVCASAQVWANLTSCGWPGPSNTGYPAGQAFVRSVIGGVVVTTDNTVIDGWKVDGGIQVRAQNVTIRNSWVTSSFAGAGGSGVININPGASATIEHTLLDGLNATHSCVWHEGLSMSSRANNCQGVNDGIFMWATQPGVDGTGDNFTIQDNYLHSFTTLAANGHIDGIQTEGAKNGVIRHNTIDVSQDQDSAIAIWNGRKDAANIQVDHNLMAGGGFAVYAEDYSPSEANPAGGYTVTSVSFTNNVFSTVHFGCVGNYGVWFSRGEPSDGWRRSGNVVLETGQKIDTSNPSFNGQLCS